MNYEGLRQEFHERGFVLASTPLAQGLVSIFYDYLCIKLAHNSLPYNDGQSDFSYFTHADPLFESLLGNFVPLMQEITGLKLFPTYSYLRVYQKGATLVPHRDRPSCEISATLTLGFEGESLWPLFIEGPRGVAKVTPKPGEMVVYRGIECRHWREPYQGTQQAQVFLHYVNQEGPYRDFKYDKRPFLGLQRRQGEKIP